MLAKQMSTFMCNDTLEFFEREFVNHSTADTYKRIGLAIGKSIKFGILINVKFWLFDSNLPHYILVGLIYFWQIVSIYLQIVSKIEATIFILISILHYLSYQWIETFCFLYHLDGLGILWVYDI